MKMNSLEYIESIEKENHKMRGNLSAISNLLNAYDVPKLNPVNKRLKMLLEMYQRDKHAANILRVQPESGVADD